MYNDLLKDKKLAEFMRNTKVSFEQLIRCFNFWDRLSSEEKEKYIEIYMK